MQSLHDPSHTSYYVNDALYRRLIATFEDWHSHEPAVGDPAVREQARLLLQQAAELVALSAQPWDPNSQSTSKPPRQSG